MSDELFFTYSATTILKVVSRLQMMRATAKDDGRAAEANEIEAILYLLMERAPALFGPTPRPKE